MQQPTPTLPHTHDNGAVWVLLSTTLVVVALAVLVSLAPVPLGGVGMLALALGIVGLGAVVVIEGGAQ